MRPILMLILAATCYADSKTEADLRARLAEAERARVTLAAELARINARTAATLAATKSATSGQAKAADVASAHADVAQATAEDAAAAAKDSADKAVAAVKAAALDAHKDAESIASKIFVSSGPFIVAQTFLLLSLCAGFVFKMFERRADVLEAERKEDRANKLRVEAAGVAAETLTTMKVVHTLVNSSLTKALNESLAAQRLLLPFLIERAGVSPSVQDAATIGDAKAKIATLEAQLRDRLGDERIGGNTP
jgi:hypothetical protein